MKTFKKILCSMLVVVICLTSAPLDGFIGIEWPEINLGNFKLPDIDFGELFSSKANALASTGQCGDNVYWNYNNTTGELVISGTGAMYDYGDSGLIDSPFVSSGIRTIVIGEGVTTIGNEAFGVCRSLTSVTIGNSVTTIGGCAFTGCDDLTSVTIPDSVITIESSAFFLCCSLTSVTIGNSVTTIGDYAFASCIMLENISLTDSVESIGAHAFNGCHSVVNITIPDSVVFIGEGAFNHCYSSHITVDKNNLAFSSDSDGILFNKNKTKIIKYPYSIVDASYKIPDSVTVIGKYAFESYYLTDVIISDNVTTIEDYAFEGCDRLESLDIGDGLTIIGEYAFYSCQLTSLIISDSVESIGAYAFGMCSNLTSLTIGKNVTNIEEGVFEASQFEIVSYNGTKEQWKNINIGDYNECLTDATIHYLGNNIPTVMSTTYKGVTATLADDYFSGDSKVYNHDLAKFCSLFTVIGYEYSKEIIKGYLEECGFSADKKYIVTNASKEQVNNFISHKEIVVNQKVYTLVFAGYIGSYKDQWYSNFDPGTGTTHKGFANAKNYVYPILEDYIKGLGVPKEETIILLTGHSRGAATSNLVAKQLIDDEKYATKENIYTYAFATPNSTSLSERKAEKYKRIINIVNPEDLVTKLLPSAWGYGRYGVTYTLPSKTNLTKNYYNTLKNNMQKEYALLLDGESYHPYPGGESQTYDLVYSMTKNVKNIRQLYERKFRWFGEYVSVQEFITQTLCRYMASNIGSEAKNEAQALVVATWLDRFDNSGLILDLADYFVIYQGLGGLTSGVIMDDYFQEAHQVETYCAYIMSMTKGQVTSSKDSYKGSVNCPVDVEIYDKSTGELVGKIVNNVVDEEVAAKENSVVMSVDGDSKSFWLPSNGDYDIRLIGNDSGTMDYTMSEIDSDIGEVKRVNFFDIEITDGLTMTADVDAEEFVIEEHELTFENGETLEPTEIFTEEDIETYNIDISTSEGGTASSSQTAKSGDYVSLDAEADKCWKFIGWYENNDLISTESTLAFVAKSNRSIEARFKFDKHTFGSWNEITPATCKTTGTEQRVCSECEYAETREIPLNKHSYEPAVTPATCHSTGFTTNTCKVCGDSYTSDVTNMIPHNMGNWYVIKPAECQINGVEQRDCSACNYSETQAIPTTGHNYNNGVCTSCGDDLTANCSCNCHTSGISGLIFKIILFFQKLFRLNRICEGCGVSHY